MSSTTSRVTEDSLCPEKKSSPNSHSRFVRRTIRAVERNFPICETCLDKVIKNTTHSLEYREVHAVVGTNTFLSKK